MSDSTPKPVTTTAKLYNEIHRRWTTHVFVRSEKRDGRKVHDYIFRCVETGVERVWGNS